MVKFCPECGYKLVREFKFCPECGFELEKIKNDKNAEDQASNETIKETGFVEKKVCDNCGEENDIENIICSGCGVKLTGAKTGKFSVNSSEQQENVSQKAKPKTAVKTGNTKKNIVEAKSSANAKIKSLNKAKTITIIAVGVGIAFVILIFSGLLNSIIVPGNSISSNTKYESKFRC